MHYFYFSIFVCENNNKEKKKKRKTARLEIVRNLRGMAIIPLKFSLITIFYFRNTGTYGTARVIN